MTGRVAEFCGAADRVDPVTSSLHCHQAWTGSIIAPDIGLPRSRRANAGDGLKLITRVEVAYFRSIYKERLDKLEGTNVLFGRNDAGKSNVLRALNLFFNGETNRGQPFVFDRDLCHARLAEADPTRNIRKFAYVKLWFDTPETWRQSLGDEFWVKKQWSITRETDPHFDSSIAERRRHQYLTRFLKRVRFHYVPAIKDRRIFEQLLAEIYSVVASQAGFADSLLGFSETLRERTDALTAGLAEQLAVNSIISPPDDLTDLFRSLDFETNSEEGDSYSLTLQRGDGIQVRHIPAILGFISDQSAEEFHIWGFEEPENSLELANAIEEAALFSRYGEDANKQVFLTSHSPAFFALKSPSVARYFVSRSEARGARLTSKLTRLTGDELAGDLMGETPHLPVISSYLSEAHAKIVALQDEGDGLATELAERDRSVLFVEGESDRTILAVAWDVLIGGERPFDIEDSSGTTKMEALGSDGRVINRLAPERRVFVLVDNDRAGRGLYSHGRLGDGANWVRHNSNGVHWCRLPFAAPFAAFMGATGIPKAHWPGCLENLFEPALRKQALAEGALALTDVPHEELLDPQRYPAIQPYITGDGADERFWVLGTDPATKLGFADWIAERAQADASTVEVLRTTLERLDDLLKAD